MKPLKHLISLLFTLPLLGADLKSPLSDLASPFIAAVQNNHFEQVENYLDYGGEVDVIDPEGYSVLEHAACKGYAQMTGLLIEKGVNVHYVDPFGNTALHMACIEGFSSVSEALLQKSKDELTVFNKTGQTPLHMASQTDKVDLVDLLIRNGAPVNVLSLTDQKTPLWFAARKGSVPVITRLINAGARLDLSAEHNVSPLMIACFENHVEAASLLLNHYQTPPNEATDQGVTPLMIACFKGNKPLVELLLSRGAEVTKFASQTLGGAKAYHYALKGGFFEIATLLQNAEARHHAESPEIVALREEIRQMKDQHQQLWGHHLQKKSDEFSRQYILNNTYLRTFYETFSRRMVEFFLAYKVLDTGMVSQNKEGSAYTLASGINLAGNFIPFPGAGLITQGISMAITTWADRKEAEIVKTFAEFTVFLHDLDKAIEEGARHLTYCYEQQIRELTPDGCQILAECAIRRFLEYGRAGNFNKEQHFWQHLKQSILYFNDDSFFKKKSLKIRTQSVGEWEDQNIFRETGIHLRSGERYIDPRIKGHEVFGFRLGMIEDAEKLGYVKEIPLLPNQVTKEENSTPKTTPPPNRITSNTIPQNNNNKKKDKCECSTM